MSKAQPQVAATGKAITLTAKAFVQRMELLKSPEEAAKYLRYFKTREGDYGAGDVFMGVRMGQVFGLAKEFIAMPLKEIEQLLESNVHEVRAGALSIMDKQARMKTTTDVHRKELYDLYMRRHDRINNWDLVDVSCIHVVGRYLYDKPRAVLYKLTKSKNVWERRTAIVSTAYFLSKKDTADTFKIAELLINDSHDLIHKATGGWIRQAGKSNKTQLLGFLDKYAASMPRTTLRYAIEHLDAMQKKHYMDMKGKVAEKGKELKK